MYEGHHDKFAGAMLSQGMRTEQLRNSEKPIVEKWQVILLMLDEGWDLVYHLAKKAVWLSKDGKDSDFKVSHGVRHYLMNRGFAKESGVDGYHAHSTITKLGKQIAAEVRRGQAPPEGDEVAQNERPRPVPPAAGPPKPEPKDDRVVAKKEEELYDDDQGFTAFLNKLPRGDGYLLTIRVRDALTLSRLTAKLAVATANPTAKAKVAMDRASRPASMAVCYYCSRPFARSGKGAKPWRVVCRDPQCRKRYLEDVRTKKELDAQGIDTSTL